MTQDINLSHNEIFNTIDLDSISCIFTEKYMIILFDFQGNPFPVFIPFSGTNRYEHPHRSPIPLDQRVTFCVCQS